MTDSRACGQRVRAAIHPLVIGCIVGGSMACSPSADTTTKTTTTAADAGVTYQIVIAMGAGDDLATGTVDEGGCHRDNPDHCRLYSLRYSPSTGTVTSAVQVGTIPGLNAVQWFPALSPDGARVAFDEQQGFDHDVRVCNANGTGCDSSVLIQDARFPNWPEADQMAFMKKNSPAPSDTRRSDLDLTGPWPVTIGSPEVILQDATNGYQDPSQSPSDSTLLVQHYEDPHGAYPVVAQWNSGTSAFDQVPFKLTPTTGSAMGHCAFSPSGSSIACTSAQNGNMWDFVFDGTSQYVNDGSPLFTPNKPSDFAYPRFTHPDSSGNAPCDRVSHSYVEFCEDTVALASVQCEKNDGSGWVDRFSRVYLVDFHDSTTAPIYVDITDGAIRALGLTETPDSPYDSVTAACRVLAN